MLARLLVNWKYKLLAFACAWALHTYVVGQENPRQTRTVSVPLTTQNIPQGMLLNQKALPPVTVTLDGPPEAIERLNSTSLLASVDLSRAVLGGNANLPVHVELPLAAQKDIRIIDTRPTSVSLSLKPQRKRRMLITAAPPGTPPAGFEFRAPVIAPKQATVVGEQDAVDSIAKLLVKIDPDSINAAGTVDDELPIIPLDNRGSQVSNVVVSPSTAHVRIGIARVPAMKALLVSPIVINTPPFPYKISDIQVKPQTVLVTGRPERLTSAATVTTAPVDVAGATQDLVREVACIAPPGTSLSQPQTVTVTVRIVTQQPMVEQSASPTAPAP